jgi:hypothetical protein
MAIGRAFKSLFEGKPAEAFNFLFVPQDVIDASTDVDSRWEQFLANQVRTGRESNEQAARTLQNIDSTDVNSGAVFTNPDLSPLEGFKQGWDLSLIHI